MFIKSIKSQHRRDFQAVYKCEYCGDEINGHGYDDQHFHNNVIPEMKCKQCGKTASDDYRPLTPKYSGGEQI